MQSTQGVTADVHICGWISKHEPSTVADVKNLHQEINKHLTLSTSMNQVVSYWLLPFFLEIAVHEDQGMICSIVGSAVASKTLTALNTAKLLIEMHIVSDISLNIRQYTLSSSDIVHRLCFSVLSIWTLIAILKQTVLRMVWKVQEVTAERYRTLGHVSGVREPTPFLCSSSSYPLPYAYCF